MKLKNVLIVVKDIEKSRKFYHDLFGLDLILDNDGNMILTEGLVLQDERSSLGRRSSLRITPVSCILRRKTWRHSFRNLKICTRRSGM